MAKGSKDGKKQENPKDGLSYDEMAILETRVLPTAKRWLTIPGLADHGEKTVEYWGEKP